jgi:deoxyribodipyrimidine photolyase
MRGVHWFRNDLRLRDNTALADAASACDELVLLFVLDDALLAQAGPPRRRFLHVHEPWRVGPERGAYPDPIVSHAERRLEAIARFDAARSGARGGC